MDSDDTHWNHTCSNLLENFRRILIRGMQRAYSSARLELSTIGNDNSLAGLARLRAVAFDLLDDLHAFDDAAENNVLAVEPWGLHGGNASDEKSD